MLVLAPHADDGEFACGATISRLVEEKKEIFYVSFSFCKESVPAGFPKDILEKEMEQSTKSIGIKKLNLIKFDFPVRRFEQFRQDILDNMIKLRNSLKPDLVLLPSTDDIHQDHQVISNEAIRAFKHSSLWGYEMPWNNIRFTPNHYVHLNKKHVDKKISAIKKYRSQSHRNYAEENFLRSIVKMRGVQAGAKYAEAFEIIRMHYR